MKIVIAHYKYYIQGGPERYMLKFMKLAEEHGHTVIPFSVRYPQNLPTPYDRYFVSPKSKNSTGRFDAANLTPMVVVKGAWNEFHNGEAKKNLRRLIREEKPDLLYVLIPGMLSADIFKVAKEEGVPVILRLSDFRVLCGSYSLRRGEEVCEECIYGKYRCMVKHRCVKKSRLLSFLRMWSLSHARRRKTYRYVDAVIAPPKFTGDLMVRSGFFSKEKVHVNPTFIDASAIVPSEKRENYVLCLGRFSPEKGFIYVVEALRYLKDLPVTVAVTGDKENCDATLKEVIGKYDLEDKVKFVGFLQGEELERVTAQALCVACPAIWYENLPNVVLEAYAYGKPVIASDIGSLAEVVEDGKTGLLFEPKNVEQIAACIRRLYEDPALCESLGRGAREKCEREYSPEKHWERFVTICQGVGVNTEKVEEDTKA